MKYIVDLVEYLAILGIVIGVSSIIGIIGGAATEKTTTVLAVAWLTTALSLSAVLFGEYKEKQKR